MKAQLFDEDYESNRQHKLRELVVQHLIRYNNLNQDNNEKSYVTISKKNLPQQLTAYDIAYVANYLNVGLTLKNDALRIYFSEKPEQFVDDYHIDETFNCQKQLHAYRLCTTIFNSIKLAIIVAGILLLWFIVTAILDKSFTLNIVLCCAGLLLFFAIANLVFAKFTQKKILNNLRKVLEQNKLT